ncbi:MAG: glycoside hydrolase family 127 protein, partial [Phycisphaerae bacterium]|nr:glycoside hydrolase family 127 protein [Phycisphaerae bacterium]
LGSQDPKTGGMTYFYSMKPGHFKTYSTEEDSMWCCVGTGIENHAKYGDTIYYHDADSLWVNLFIPSKLDWKDKGVTVTQETKFPNTDTTTIKLSVKKAQKLTVKIRVPYWATKGVEVSVNGKAQKVTAKPQSYLALTRQWKDGDTIKVRLPMSLHLYTARDDKKLGVVMFGPLVLAGELETKDMPKNLCCTHNKQYSGDPVPPVPVIIAPSKDLSAWIKRTDDKALRFKTQNAGKPNDVSLIPLGEMHHQRYTVYWKFFTADDWAKEQASRRAAALKLKELEANTIDKVIPATPGEKAHNFKGKGSGAGSAFGGKWRDARGGGWFSYEMKVSPDKPVSAMVKYWGSDAGGRIFDILVDDKKIATYDLAAPKPGKFIDVKYPIPPELTKGKKKVTIRFQAHPGRIAGGIFECRIIKGK